MRFRVLGPLVIEDGSGQPLHITAHRELVVLARLLLAPGGLVRRSEIVEGLWKDHPPPSAYRTLDSYLSRWRSRLHPIAIAPLGREAVRLEITPGETDAGVFRLMVAAADDAPAEEAVDLLGRALGLWRGAPFPELEDWPHVAPDLADLIELRSQAEEDQVDLTLRIGDHRGAVVMAERLVAEAPLRERRWAQLMKALAGSGRQAEALRTFARCRSLLVEDLGLEPGPDLVELEQRILARDPGLLAPSPPASGKARPRPPLAVDVGRFFGRTAELAAATDAIGQHRIVTITGAGGVGKTRLALQVAACLQEQFPDGIYLVELAPLGAASPISFAVANALGLKQQPGSSVEDTICAWIGTKRLLLVLDNCEHVLDEVRSTVERFVRSNSNLHICHTSRGVVEVAGEHVIVVPPLGSADIDEDAIALFNDRALARRPRFRATSHHEAVAAICAAVDYLPLAIELAAARCSTMTPEEIATHLQVYPELLDSVVRRDRHSGVSSCVAWTTDLLPPDVRRAFATLSVFRGGFDLEAAVSLLGRAAPVMLHALVSQSLVIADENGQSTRYRMLEPVRQYAGRMVDDHRDVELRHARYYADLMVAIDQWFLGTNVQQATSTFDREFANFRAAFDASLRHGRVDLATTIVTSAGWIAREQIAVEVFDWCDRVIAFSKDLGHPQFVDLVATSVSGRYLELDVNAVAAIHDEVMSDPAATALSRYRVSFDLAWVLVNHNRTDEALAPARQATIEATDIGNKVLLSGALSTEAVCLERSQNHENQTAAKTLAAESIRIGDLGGDYSNVTSRVFAARFAQGNARLELLREAETIADRVGLIQFMNVARRLFAEEMLAAGRSPKSAAPLLIQCLETWGRLRVPLHWWAALEAAAVCLALDGQRDVADQIWAAESAAETTPGNSYRRATLGLVAAPEPVRVQPLSLDELTRRAIIALDAAG